MNQRKKKGPFEFTLSYNYQNIQLTYSININIFQCTLMDSIDNCWVSNEIAAIFQCTDDTKHAVIKRLTGH